MLKHKVKIWQDRRKIEGRKEEKEKIEKKEGKEKETIKKADEEKEILIIYQISRISVKLF